MFGGDTGKPGTLNIDTNKLVDSAGGLVKKLQKSGQNSKALAGGIGAVNQGFGKGLDDAKNTATKIGPSTGQMN